MLEIKAWQGENNTTTTRVTVNGSSLNDLSLEFMFGVTKALRSIGERVEEDFGKEAAEKTKNTLMAAAIALFIEDCTDRFEDAEFFKNMADGAEEFLRINIALNKPDAKEKMADTLDKIFDALCKDEAEPEGEANGTE